MDPQAYCEQTIADLFADRSGPRPDLDSLQRAAVLAYLAQQRLSAPDFERELTELSAVNSQRRPNVAAAARAVLRDWQARTRSG